MYQHSVCVLAAAFCGAALAQDRLSDGQWAAELVSIRDSTTQRVVDYNIDLGALEAAHQAGDQEQIASLFHYITPMDLAKLADNHRHLLRTALLIERLQWRGSQHAELAVDMAGSMASFLSATLEAKK